MFTTAFLTICGAIFIFVYKEGFKPEDGGNWHPILGIILIGLAILQVLGAFFRPLPTHEYRPLFNWLHWGLGNTAHIVGGTMFFFCNIFY